MKHLIGFSVVFAAVVALVNPVEAADLRLGINGGLNYAPVTPTLVTSELGFVAGGNLEFALSESVGYQGFLEYARVNYETPDVFSESIDWTHIFKLESGGLYFGPGVQAQFFLNAPDGTDPNINLALAVGLDLGNSLFLDLRGTTDFGDLFDTLLTTLQIGLKL